MFLFQNFQNRVCEIAKLNKFSLAPLHPTVKKVTTKVLFSHLKTNQKDKNPFLALQFRRRQCLLEDMNALEDEQARLGLFWF